MVQLAQQVQLLLVRLVQAWEQQAQPVIQVLVVCKVIPEPQGQQALLLTQVPLAPQAILVLLVQQVQSDHRVYKVFVDSRVRLVRLVLVALTAW